MKGLISRKTGVSAGKMKSTGRIKANGYREPGKSLSFPFELAGTRCKVCCNVAMVNKLSGALIYRFCNQHFWMGEKDSQIPRRHCQAYTNTLTHTHKILEGVLYMLYRD